MADDKQLPEEDFLAGLRDSGDTDPLDQKEEDPFASLEKDKEVSTENEETVVEEKRVPFNQDPKLQRYIDKEISKRMSEQTPQQEERESDEKYFDGVVEAFTKIVGNDTPEKVTALRALQDSLENLDQRAADKAIGRLESVRQEEVALEQHYDDRLSDGFETIEDETGVDLYAPQNKKLRIQFIDFIEKVAPKEDGEISELPDIGEAFKAFVATKRSSQSNQMAKDLASHSMDRSDGTASVATPQKGLTWDNVRDRIFGE